MNSVRVFFTNGKYRNAESFIVCALFLVVFYYKHGVNTLTSLSSFFKTGTFILTSMGLVAYNLRNKVIDNVLKMIQERRDYRDIAEKAKKCGKELTSIVVLSIFSLCSTYFASVFPTSLGIISYLVVCVAFCLFIRCTILYLHVLLTFDSLENDILDYAVEQRDTTEKKRREEYIEAGKKEHPDN